jgi:hypothetical protein
MNTVERLLVFAVFIAEFTCRRQLVDQGLRPAPGLSPLEVVKIQVYSLQHYNEPRPNAGIWTAFQFASPANRGVTGPYGHFLQLLKSPGNRPFLNARSAWFSDERRDGSHAAVTVALEHRERQRSRFTFSLSLQGAGPFKGCWMTDGVRPSS